MLVIADSSGEQVRITGADKQMLELSPPTMNNLLEWLSASDINTWWATETHLISDNREEVATAIRSGDTIVMANGSFKKGHGTLSIYNQREVSPRKTPGG